MKYIYTSKIEEQYQPNECLEILMVIEYFGIDRYKQFIKKCEYDLKSNITIQNCIETIKLSFQYDQQSIIDYLIQFISINYDQVSKLPQFQTLHPNIIDQLMFVYFQISRK